MEWKQLHSPDVSVSAPPGLCLFAVQTSYSAPWSGSTATDAWDRAQFKHPNELPPKGISVPIYFSLKNNPAGHIVTGMPDGSVYSASDMDIDFDYHPSVDALMKYYGNTLTLRGWSEDLNGWRIVEPTEGDEMVTQKMVQYMGRIKLGRDIDPKQIADLTQSMKTFDDLEKWFESLPEYKDKIAASKVPGKFDPRNYLVYPYNNYSAAPTIAPQPQFVEVTDTLYKKKG